MISYSADLRIDKRSSSLAHFLPSPSWLLTALVPVQSTEPSGQTSGSLKPRLVAYAQSTYFVRNRDSSPGIQICSRRQSWRIEVSRSSLTFLSGQSSGQAPLPNLPPNSQQERERFLAYGSHN